jgi:hypothetical protein
MPSAHNADEVHLHIPVGFTGTIHVHLGGGSSDQAAPRQPTDTLIDPTLAAMLTRFERYNPSVPSATDVATTFLSRGYKPLLPQTGASVKSDSSYIRWVYAGSAKTVRLYQNSVAISSYAQDQAVVASNVAGCIKKKSGWYFYLTLGPEAIEFVLNAFIDYANGTS